MMLELVEKLDKVVIEACAKYAHQSELIDKFFISVLGRPTFKFLPFMILLWFLWFRKEDNQKSRLCVVNVYLATFTTIFLSRVVQNTSMERPRPMHNPEVTHYVAPYGVDTKELHDWSSFPSDHAAIAFSISTCLFFYNKFLGVASALFSLFIICFPRVYGGYHYTSDILGGVVLGVACGSAVIILKDKVGGTILDMTERLESRFQPYFYAFAFFLSYQVATMFNDIRWPAMALVAYFNQ